MKGCSDLVVPPPHGRKVGKLLRKNMRKAHFRGREGRKVTNRPRAVGVPVSFASRTRKEERSLTVGVRAIEKEQEKRENPGEPEAQTARGNTYTMQERCRRAQVHFWPIAIEVDGHCSASFLKFFTNVCMITPLRN